MKKIFFVSALVGLSLFSCKKDEVTATNATSAKTVKTHAANDKTLQCSPWQDEDDIPTAVNDLNAIVQCNTSTCSGSVLNTWDRTGFTVLNSTYTAVLYFSFFAPGSISTQNYIWSNALNQAATNCPVGYSISCVHNFNAVLVAGGGGGGGLGANKFKVTFDILYIQCGDGGGDHN